MGKKLYVGNLPYEMTNSQLQELFSGAGTVESASVVMDNFSGRSKGFGFVEMANDSDAPKAIEMFNGSELGGRKIVVNEARPKTEHRPRDSFHGRGGYGGGDRYGGPREGRRRNDNHRDRRSGGWGDRGR